jgi:hypothetical protein
LKLRVLMLLTATACSSAPERTTQPLFDAMYNNVVIEPVSGAGDYLAKNSCGGYYAKAMSSGYPSAWERDVSLDWSTPTFPAQLVSFDQLSPAKATTTHLSGDAVNVCAIGDGFAEFTVYPTTFYVDVGNAAASVSINGPASIHDVDPPHSDYTALVTDPYGKQGDRTPKATWASSNPVVASIDASRRVVPHTKGTFTLTGTVYGKSGSGTVTVLGVSSVVVSPQGGTVTVGKTLQLSAVGKYSDGFQTSAKPASWQSSDPAIATVNSSTGLVTGVHYGPVTITATIDGISGSTTVNVTGGQISGYYVTSLSGAPTPITSAGTYYLTPTTTTEGAPPVKYKWEVTYSNGVLPNVATGWQSGAFALRVPAGAYKITVTVTPQQYWGDGYPTAFNYPVCTPGSTNTAQPSVTSTRGIKRPGDGGIIQKVVWGCGKDPV